MKRYGYTFIQPSPGSAKFTDFRAFLYFGGFFFWLASVVVTGYGEGFFFLIFVPLFTMLFFAYLAEEFPFFGLSCLVLLSAGHFFYLVYTYSSGSSSNRKEELIIALVFLGLSALWSIVMLAFRVHYEKSQHNQ